MAEQLATRFAIPRYYASLDEMLAAERPEVVHVATPPHSHLAIARKCVAAGAHLFIEKPFALTAAESCEIIDACRAARRLVCVNYLYNFEKPALELEDCIAAGRLGTVIHAESNYGYNLAGDYGTAVLADPQHWVHRLPGRLFHNVLDHVFAKIAPFMSDDDRLEVKTLAFRRRPAVGNPVIDGLGDELRFMLRSGAFTASGSVSAFGRPVPHTLRLVGTADTAELDYGARTMVFAARQSQPSAAGRLFPAWAQARAFRSQAWRNARDFAGSRFHYFQPMRVLLQRFYDAIALEDAPEPIPAAVIMRVARLIDAVVADLAPVGQPA
jgi:predicted dehydrogenase